MYKILIAEDEAIERDVIRFLLDQQDHGMQIYEAANGQEALELLQKEPFDILFTDIQMPFIDGFALAEKAISLQPDISVIFFTCHDDFTYVKKALTLNAANYIMKPVDPEEFHTTISNAVSALRTRDAQNTILQSQERITRNYILRRLLEGANISNLQTHYPNTDFSFLDSCCRLVLIQPEDIPDSAPLLSLELLNEFLPAGCFFLNLTSELNVVFLTEPEHEEAWYEGFAIELSSHLQHVIHAACTIVVSTSIPSPEDIALVYEETVQKLFKNSLIKDRSTETSVGVPEADDILNMMKKDIQINDWKSLHIHIKLLIDSFKNVQPFSYIYCRFMCTSALKILLDGFPLEERVHFNEYAAEISGSFNLSSMESLLVQIADKLISLSRSKDSDTSLHILRVVKQYIQQHYADDLSLDILAKEVFISKSYLSKLFAEYHGYGINKYIKNVRMEKARELLLTTAMPIHEISKRVGYSTDSYFCKSFMKEFGVTPDKFRNNDHFA